MASTTHKKNDDYGCGCGSWIFATILIVTPCLDTPAVGPDTPDMEFLSHLNFSIWAPQPLKLTHPSHSSLSLSLSLSLVTLSSSHSPKSPLSPQTLELKNPHPKSIPRPRKLQSAWGIIFSRYSTMGWLRFLVFLQGELAQGTKS